MVEIDLNSGGLRINGRMVTKNSRVSDVESIDKKNFRKISEVGNESEFLISIFEYDGNKFVISASFNKSVIESIQFNVSDEGGWDSWSEKREKRNFKLLSNLMRKIGLDEREKFIWGSVELYYSSKSGFSTLRINYLDK